MISSLTHVLNSPLNRGGWSSDPPDLLLLRPCTGVCIRKRCLLGSIPGERSGWNCKKSHENSLPLTISLSQKFTEPSKGISYPVGGLWRPFTKLTGPSVYTLHNNPIPPTDSIAFCDLSHTFHKQVTMFLSRFVSSKCREF